MDIDILSQELTEKISSLQTELDNYKRQKEIITIIKYLKSIKNIKLGYHTVMARHYADLDISRECMNDFINLFDSSEYLKGYSNGGSSFLGQPKETKFDIYYLTLGVGTVLELTFSETIIKGVATPIKGSRLTIRTFADSQDLSVKVNDKAYGWPIIEILNKDGEEVFSSNTTPEYLEFNNKKLSEALVPISVDDLDNRFLSILQKQEEKELRIS